MSPDSPRDLRRKVKSTLPALIDTSAWILALRKDGPARARNHIDMLISENHVAICGIVRLELLSGARTGNEYLELKEDLESLLQLKITDPTWEMASHLAYRMRRKGITVPSADVLIVAIAMENDCDLLHADRHFDLMIEQGAGFPASRAINLLVER